MLLKFQKCETFLSEMPYFSYKVLATDFYFFSWKHKKRTFKTGIFVKTTNTVYAVHAVLQLMIYTFCMHRYLAQAFFVTVKSVNNAIYAI